MSLQLDDDNFEQEVPARSKPLLICFMSSFCGPSHHLFPLLDELVAQDNGIDYAEIDVEKCPKMTRAYQVKGTPMLVWVNKGEPLGSRVGTMSDAYFDAFIKQMLEKSK